jgi:hypothetical protein
MLYLTPNLTKEILALMSKSSVFLISVVTAALFFSLLTGCVTSPAGSGETSAELEAARKQIDELEDKLGDSQAKVTALQQQIMELGAEIGLTGDTPDETARNIVKHYHDIHTYSKADLFVCADMAMDVWNMLQAQGIDAVIQIGNVEKAVTDMQESSHAWVVAEVAPGEFLALETTNGQAVSRAENPLYYAGWSFDNPQEYKRFEELKYEHNIRVSVYNSMVEETEGAYQEYQAAYNEYQELVGEFNSRYAGQVISDEAQALYDEINARLAVMKEAEGRYNQLQLLMAEQQQELDRIVPQMQSLAQ